MRQKLQQRLTQGLAQRINPQLVALGRLLEMGAVEFEDEIRRQLDENPALEARDESADISEIARDEANADDTDDAEGFNEEYYPDDDFDDDYNGEEDICQSAGDRPAYDFLATTADNSASLYDILFKRITDDFSLDGRRLSIASHIIGNLDSNGYMTRSMREIGDEVTTAEGFEPTQQELRDAFNTVRSLDPPGIGAVDLRDCLALQLSRLAPATPGRDNALEIMRYHFDEFSKFHYKKLAAAMHITDDELARAVDLIRSLNPRPAGSIASQLVPEAMMHINADFSLEYDASSDRFTLSLLNPVPELAVEASFATDPQVDARNAAREAARLFIRSKREEAQKIIRLARLRSETLLAVAGAIVNRQRRFFISGDKTDISPMILKDIASDTGLDISTVSRAASAKYILTAHGIFPLKMLFNERPNSETDASAIKVMDSLKKMIETENPDSPLSDRDLTEALAAKGYEIARRTVAKYRERLGYPVARLRKKI